jgi:fluoride ion exporter CrcB/FEX
VAAGGILETDIGTAACEVQVSRLQTEAFTISYLVFFSILGTLGRVGLSALTSYPGAPVIFESIWPNFAGCLVMGFLAEDRMLFRTEPLPGEADNIEMGRRKSNQEEDGSSPEPGDNGGGMTPAQIKKTIPLYIGLATGFCGSLTSFSSFVRDAFLALSNDIVSPDVHHSPTHRNGGYSFMAFLAVIILTITLSLSALFIGAHIAIAVARFTLSIRYPITRHILDPAAVILGWGSWIGAVLLAIFPPHDFWRGRAVFAIVFAPLGCLLRFYVSLHLNGIAASFPVGTFTVNVFGTGVLGMCWDIAHAQIGGVIGCQVLQGIEDGFCGALTTVSTWVAELSSLRRKHAYTYGATSVVVSLLLLIAVMGGLRWSDGFKPLLCST